MMFENFDKTTVILDYLDKSIKKMIIDGKDFNQVISELNRRSDSFSKILNESEKVDTRYKYIYTCKGMINKRISDINNILRVRENGGLYKFSKATIFNLVIFKDKFSSNSNKII